MSKPQRPLVDQPTTVVRVPVTVCDQARRGFAAPAADAHASAANCRTAESSSGHLETQQEEVVCPCCQHTQTGVLPKGLEATRQFGPRLEALVTYLHHEHHVSFQRVQGILRDLLHLDLSAGGVVAMLERAGAAAQPEAEAIGEAVRHSSVIGSDETSARVNGRNWWNWVFESQAGEYHVIVPSRGFDVIEAFMQQARANVWRSDCWKAQLKAPLIPISCVWRTKFATCKGCIHCRPHLRWGGDLQDLFRTAIHLGNRRDQMPPLCFQGKRHSAGRNAGTPAVGPPRHRGGRRQVAGPLSHPSGASVRVSVSARRGADQQCLRTRLAPVGHSSQSDGQFRSEWGAQANAALATVLNTAKRHGENGFAKLVYLMGKPILHYLAPSIA